jgi:hypothetical protein
MDSVFPNLVEYTALIAGAVSVIVIALCWVRYYPEHEPDEAAKPLPPRELPALNGLPYIPVGSTHCRP